MRQSLCVVSYLLRQHGEKLLLGDQSDGLINGFPILEKDQNREAHHTVLFGDILRLVHIDLADLNLRMLCSNLLHNGREHTAGSAPRCPEINDDNPICVQHLVIKCCSVARREEKVYNI